MTGAERYLLDQLDLCLAQGDIDEAERYAAELRQELDPATETVAARNHENEPDRNSPFGRWPCGCVIGDSHDRHCAAQERVEP